VGPTDRGQRLDGSRERRDERAELGGQLGREVGQVVVRPRLQDERDRQAATGRRPDPSAAARIRA
jgi:hypothetical protein